jgi:general secretion pathway protein D
MTVRARVALLLAVSLLIDGVLHAQSPPERIAIRFIDASLPAVVQALGRHLPKPLVVSNLPQDRVTIDYPQPVAPSTIPSIIRALLDNHNLTLVEDSSYFRIAVKADPPRAIIAAPAPVVSDATLIRLFVTRLKHAPAADVAATLNQLFGAGGTFSDRPGLATGTLTEQLRPPSTPAADPTRPTARAQGQIASLTGQVLIVSDELTNALLIRANTADYEVLSTAIVQLDVRPLQVLVEVMIVEARRDRLIDLGVDLTGEATRPTKAARARLSGAGAGDMVVNFMRMSRVNVNATLSLAYERGDIQILSRPVLVASNNTEAHFLVGAQRPFVQVSRSLPTDNAARDQVVQYKDVGTKLTVRPTINEDGYVSLLLQQEISAATTETQFDAPVISTREARTQILVRDGQTLVIGGLTDQQSQQTRSGIPLLSEIPFIGGLFGRQKRTSNATELFLFLTPRILRTDADADSVTAPRLNGGRRPNEPR